MVSSFHPHSICKKVERLQAKTGCTSCTKRTISIEVSGFHTETRLLQRDFVFLNLFEVHSFSVFKMHHSKPHHQFSTLADFICYFSCIYWIFFSYMTLKMKSSTNELWKGWNLFELQTFCVFKMHHSKPHQQFSTLSDFICYFSCIYWFFWAIRPWNWKKHYKWTLKRLKVWHDIIISST